MIAWLLTLSRRKYEISMRSDVQLTDGVKKGPSTITKTLSSVWMNRVTNEEPPGSSAFHFEIAAESYCTFHIKLDPDQVDNEENFSLQGTLKVLNRDIIVREYPFKIDSVLTTEVRLHGHYQPNIKYTVQTQISDWSMNRDVKFDISMITLLKADCVFDHGPINYLYKFRTLDELKPKALRAEQVAWGGAFAEATDQWTLENSGGEFHFFDDYPQYMVTFTPGRGYSKTERLRVTLEHVDKLDLKQQPIAFYVYDIDDFIQAHKKTHKIPMLVEHRFSLKDSENSDKWKKLHRSAPSKDVQYIEEFVDVQCDWELAAEKHVLLVPASLKQREGQYRVTVQCCGLPIVSGRTIHIRHLNEKWFEYYETFRSSWYGIGGGDINGDFFSYNPCFEIKITVPDTQLICKMIREGSENEDVPVAMYLFEPELPHQSVFLSRNLKLKCEWSNNSRVLLSATLSPEVIESEPLISTYYLVCSTEEECCNMQFDLQIFSSKPIKVRQVR